MATNRKTSVSGTRGQAATTSLDEPAKGREARRTRADETAEEAPALDHRKALSGLARLAGVDPETVIVAYEEGGPLARLIEKLLDIAPRPRGRPVRAEASQGERFCVVETLKAGGLKGKALDNALGQIIANGENVTVATYKRSAARFDRSRLAALFLDTEAVRTARDYIAQHRQIGKK